MGNLVKLIGVGLLVTGLAACDGSSTAETNAPAQGASATQPSVPAGAKVSLLDGKIGFTLPAGLSDQTSKLGSQTNNMSVYANKTGQQAVIVILAPMPQDNLNTLSTRLIDQQKSRDASLQLVSSESVKLGGKAVEKVVSMQQANGHAIYSSIILAQVGDQLMTMQISLPGDNRQEAANIANGVLDTLSFAQ
ncbi:MULTISPECIES: DcrB family lipoprotein [Edwardsiella]|uniref:Inner membrane lipoprotein DcrB n=2 Tax=Edwardsiella anguillarum TaxID=1821960 RepID=A0A076LIA2_9GAMM|nr:MULTISPECIES: DcrB family lipoprotein [Edwardsiella]AKM46380.1 DcrB protein [Edwardsiella sp. EA181011]GAJ68037.1 protein DcrB [Edwardsiella piscicida]AIJ08255.1 Hypothetical protein ETEE_1808 [Edwardsiella anguillarum ET080813]AKR76366.1 DcrB family lipoprotein [Edwardsiella sp. LADL05-105]KAB0591678.1 DUF1795 domain-containing protein [Edwardsiella anguillarum]